ncbi:hypothetical protein AGMMS50233_11270 [Endomicrobiia bacterium]|nr:hypothetical protein AGMMS50233_11270 [Endomicrobiia bacterium]
MPDPLGAGAGSGDGSGSGAGDTCGCGGVMMLPVLLLLQLNELDIDELIECGGIALMNLDRAWYLSIKLPVSLAQQVALTIRVLISTQASLAVRRMVLSFSICL